MIRFEQLTNAHQLKDVAGLYSRLYPHKAIQSDYILWRYLDNPFRPRAFVALDEGKLIGSYAGCIFPARINGVAEPLGFELDAMIHPDYQNRGVILGLYGRVIKSLRADGVAKVFAFANEAGTALFCQGFGWRRIGTRSLHVTGVAELLKRTTPPRAAVRCELDVPLGGEHAALADKVLRSTQWKAYVERTGELLRWRSKRTVGREFSTVTHRAEGGEVEGFGLFKLFTDPASQRSVGDLIEVIGVTPQAVNSILHTVAAKLEDRGVSEAATWGFPQCPPAQLPDLGFRAVPKTSQVITTGWQPDEREFLLTMLDAEMF